MLCTDACPFLVENRDQHQFCFDLTQCNKSILVLSSVQYQKGACICVEHEWQCSMAPRAKMGDSCHKSLCCLFSHREGHAFVQSMHARKRLSPFKLHSCSCSIVCVTTTKLYFWPTSHTWYCLWSLQHLFSWSAFHLLPGVCSSQASLCRSRSALLYVSFCPDAGHDLP